MSTEKYRKNYFPLLFRIEGKVTLSKLGTETIDVENQGDTYLCWLFAVARSIVQSMWVRKGTFELLI